MIGLFAPGAVCEYALFHGHIIPGAIGLAIWTPILWLFLVEVHDMGRVRFGLSAPVVLITHLIIGLWFAGWIS